MRLFGIFILLALLVGGGFLYWKYMFVFSEGNREGLINKFSKKGTIFKTNEGELLMPGVVPTMNQLSNNFFYFSVEDPIIAKKLERAIGKTVRLHYLQYNGSLPWRGDDYNASNREEGQYIVDDIDVIGESESNTVSNVAIPTQTSVPTQPASVPQSNQ